MCSLIVCFSRLWLSRQVVMVIKLIWMCTYFSLCLVCLLCLFKKKSKIASKIMWVYLLQSQTRPHLSTQGPRGLKGVLYMLKEIMIPTKVSQGLRSSSKRQVWVHLFGLEITYLLCLFTQLLVLISYNFYDFCLAFGNFVGNTTNTKVSEN